MFKSSSAIAAIRGLPNQHNGLLYGEMIDGDEGVSIVATGAAGKFSTISDSKSKFSLRVPPGAYPVTASNPEFAYTDFDLAYKDSHSVKVPDGGSAGLAFRHKEK